MSKFSFFLYIHRHTSLAVLSSALISVYLRYMFILLKLCIAMTSKIMNTYQNSLHFIQYHRNIPYSWLYHNGKFICEKFKHTERKHCKRQLKRRGSWIQYNSNCRRTEIWKTSRLLFRSTDDLNLMWNIHFKDIQVTMCCRSCMNSSWW